MQLINNIIEQIRQIEKDTGVRPVKLEVGEFAMTLLNKSFEEMASSSLNKEMDVVQYFKDELGIKVIVSR